MWGLVNTLIRISILLGTKRIFGSRGQLIRNGLTTLSFLLGIAILLVIFLICRPVAAAWYANVPGVCGSQIVSYVVLEIIGLFLDLAIVVLPPVLLWDIQITRRDWARFSLLLSMGVL